MRDAEVLVGPRIQLREPRLDDAEHLFAAVTSDPKITEFLSWSPHPDVDETRRVITELFNVGHDRTWLIVMRDSDEIVGQMGYRRPLQHGADLGYCLATRWWGRGLMSEAVGVIVRRLQQDSQLYRISATCHVDNTRSARLLEKCGFSLEGRLARYIVLPNLSPEPQDCLLYSRVLR